MNAQELQNFTLPDPKIQTFQGYQAEVKESLVLPSDGFVNKYDWKGEYIAIGCNNGSKCLYSLKENKMIHEVDDAHEIPVTCIRWRPEGHSQTNVIGVGGAEGHFQYWHVPSMKRLFTIEQPENSILCCDFTKSGEHFATAGRDCHIRIYDEQTKTISTKLNAAQWNHKGHSNRVFSIKFVDQNTLISGGWDSVIHIWDLRDGKSVKSFYGPHLAGDSIDLRQNQILVGCYSSKNQIQIWDMRNQKQMESITWSCAEDQVAHVYSCCFSPHNPRQIIAGACGVNEVRVFSGENYQHSTCVRLFDLKHGCFTVDSHHLQPELAFSTSKQGFYRCSYGQKPLGSL